MFWSDQVGPVSNFEYLFNMMDDTPAMEDEIVDVSDNSGDWGSFRSGDSDPPLKLCHFVPSLSCPNTSTFITFH